MIKKKANKKISMKAKKVKLPPKKATRKSRSLNKAKVLLSSSKKMIDRILPELAQQILKRAQKFNAQLKKKAKTK
jgi:hypothetical protein